MSYSTWHRHWMEVHIGKDAADKSAVIDLDWVEFCGQCWWPLALMELAIDTDQESKTAIVTERLATLAHLPSAVVFYRKAGQGAIARFRVRVMTPASRPERLMAPNEYAAWLWQLHANHLQICQRSYGTRDQIPHHFPESAE